MAYTQVSEAEAAAMRVCVCANVVREGNALAQGRDRKLL